MKAKLNRSRKDRIISGVCGGLAEYFGIDAVIVRIVFIIFTFISFPEGILLYIILAIIMPDEETVDITAGQVVGANVEETGEKQEPAGEIVGKKLPEFGGRIETGVDRPERAKWFGAILILLGLYFILDKFDIFKWMRNDIVLPLLLVVLGVWLLISRTRGRK